MTQSEPLATHQTCPKCGHKDCTTVFDSGLVYCHSCGETVSKPEGKQQMEPTESTDLKLETRGYRGIEKEVAEFYGIQTGVNTKGEEVTRVYPYPHKPKTRVLPKDFSSNKGFSNNYLLGMDKFNAGSSRVLTIVEGEDDVPSAYQMLGKKWPVVGLPGAGTPKQVLKNPECYNYIKSFDTIVLATDSDEAGDKSAELIQKAFPGKCYRVKMTTYKDPNDYLVHGKGSDFLYAWVNRQKYVPENILNTTDQFLSLYKDSPEHVYVPTGIEALDDKILGLMQGHFTVIKAPTGIGKTEFMRYLEFGMLKQGIPIATWHLEETKKRTLLGLVSYECNDDLTRQDIIDRKGKEQVVLDAITTLTKDENLYQFYLDDTQGADDLCEQIRYFAEVCGCQYVFFEPIQDVITTSSEEGKESALADLSVRLSKLAANLGVGIITIAHTNDNGDPKYCKMIGQRASVILDLQRNKDSELEEETNLTQIKVEKNRPTSLEGYAGEMEFNLDTFTLKEKINPFG